MNLKRLLNCLLHWPRFTHLSRRDQVMLYVSLLSFSLYSTQDICIDLTIRLLRVLGIKKFSSMCGLDGNSGSPNSCLVIPFYSSEIPLQ